MRLAKALLTIAVAGLAALAFPASGMAAQSAPSPQDGPAALKARDQATTLALLGGLVERRFAIAKTGETESNRAARDFLDARIAELRARLGR
jgi:hypothetical protein